MVIVYLMLLFFLTSCSDKTTIKTYPFQEAVDPKKNLGICTKAIFYYKADNGNIIYEEITINNLEIKINDEKKKYTVFQITEISDGWINYKKRYALLVTSEVELIAWQNWKKKWTEVELKPAFPPGYKPENLKPEKEEKEEE